MNGKKSKLIRDKSNELFVEWLKTLLRKEEAEKITLDNYFNYLPKQTHLFANRQLWLTAYTPRWISNKIKRIVERKPNLDVTSLTLADIKKEEQQWKQKEQNFPN